MQIWRRTCDMKMSFYLFITRLFMGMQAEKNESMGERLAWFVAAQQSLSAATKVGMKESSSKDTRIAETLQFAKDVIDAKLENAKKENDFIYHAKVCAMFAKFSLTNS